MRKFLSSGICDDYEESQLNPVSTETVDGEASQNKIVESLNNLPEKTCLDARIAIFESIIDEVIENAVNPNIENEVEKVITTTGADVPPIVAENPAQVEEIVDPIVDKAVALHIVPAYVKKHIPEMIQRQFEKRNPRTKLLAKAAHFLMEAVTDGPDVEGDNIAVPQPDNTVPETDKDVTDQSTNPTIQNPVEKVIETTESDAPTMSVRSLYNAWRAGEISRAHMEEEIAKIKDTPAEEKSEEKSDDSEKKPDDDVADVVESSDVAVDEGIPEDKAAALKYLAASAVNHRSATVAVSRSISGPMVSNMLNQLRYCLPKYFCKKYNVK